VLAILIHGISFVFMYVRYLDCSVFCDTLINMNLNSIPACHTQSRVCYNEIKLQIFATPLQIDGSRFIVSRTPVFVIRAIWQEA
jgi:hypothetical protein